MALTEPSAQAACPSCGASVELTVFPALVRPPARVDVGEHLIVDGESTCFYHAAKKAATVCAACGRFLCSLCAVEISGEQMCPGCMESGMKKGKMRNLAREHVHYDELALLLAALGALLFFLTPVVAPMSAYYIIRYWRAPLSAAPRRRWRFVLAGVLVVIELGMLALFVISMFGWSILR